MEEINPIQPKEIKTRLPKNIDHKFVAWLKVNSYSRNTLKNYHIQIKKMLGNKNYISPYKIKSFLSNKNNLVKNSSVKLFLIFLEDKFNIKIEPFRFPRIRKERKITIPISPVEVEKLVEGIKKDYEIKARLYDYTFFTKILFGCGLRVNESVRINTALFDWVNWVKNKEDYGSLKIIKAKDNKERLVFINPGLMQEIFEYAPRHEDGPIKKGLLFDFKHDKYIRRKRLKGFSLEIAEERYVEKVCDTYKKIIREVSEKVLGKKIHSHILRHSRASQLDNLGISPIGIRDYLGHENLSTTSRYIYNTPEKLKQQLKKVLA